MEEIYIPQLTKAPQQTQVIPVEEFLPDLETLTPVRGRIQVKHCGNYLDVSAQAETIVTLTCHRCLQQYNHRLALETSEIIWLDAVTQSDTIPLEREVALEDLVEMLPPQGYFDPGEWLYQQLCLAIPQRQLCDPQCPGIAANDPHNFGDELIDKRWAALQSLKKQYRS